MLHGQALSPGTQPPHCFHAPRSSMVTRRTNKTRGAGLRPRHSLTPHCSPAPRTGHGRRALKHRIAFMLHGQAWSPGTQTPHCFPAPRQGIVAGLSNTALLSCSTDRHGHQAYKYRIAPPFHGQALSPGAQTPHCYPAPRTRHCRQALKQRIATLLHGQA